MGGGASNSPTNSDYVSGTGATSDFWVIFAAVAILSVLMAAIVAVFARKRAVLSNSRNSISEKNHNSSWFTKTIVAILIVVLVMSAVVFKPFNNLKAIADETVPAGVTSKVIGTVEDSGNIKLSNGVIKNNGDILSIGVRYVQTESTVDLSDAKLSIVCAGSVLYDDKLGAEQTSTKYCSVPKGSSESLYYSISMDAQKAKQLIGSSPVTINTVVDLICSPKGKVVDDDGQPIKDATIVYSYYDNYLCKTVELSTTTDENGEYVIPEILKGTEIHVVITKDGKTTEVDVKADENEKIPEQEISSYSYPPSVVEGLVYSGGEQVGVFGGSNIELSGQTSATNAGNYTAYATPKGKSKWKDGTTDTKTFEWKISKADVLAPDPSLFASTAESLDNKPDGKISGVQLGMEYSSNGENWTVISAGQSEILGLKAGEYLIRYIADDNHNASNPTTVTVKAGSKTKLTYFGNGNDSGQPPVDSFEYSYNDEAIALDKGTLVKVANNFAGWNTKADGTGTSVAVGSTYKIENSNPSLYAVWTMKQAPTADMFNFEGPTREYDGKSTPATVTVKDGIEGMGEITVYYRYGKAGEWTKDAPKDIGTYYVKIEVTEGTQFISQTIESDNWAFAITPKDVTVTADNKSKTYGEADPELTAKVSGTIGTDTITYVVSRDEGENAGTYTIVPSGTKEQGNYSVEFITGEFTILQAEPTLNVLDEETYTVPTEFVIDTKYNGDGELSATSSDPTKATVEVDGVKVKVTPIDVGSISITVTASAGTNFKASEKTQQAIINAGTIVYTEEPATGLKYNGSAQKLGTVNVTFPLECSITYKVDGVAAIEPTATTVGEYTVDYKIEKIGFTTVNGSFTAIIDKADSSVELDSYLWNTAILQKTTFSVTAFTGSQDTNINYSAVSDNESVVKVTKKATPESGKLASFEVESLAYGKANIKVTVSSDNYNESSATFAAAVKKEYTLTYDKNEGTGDIPSETKKYLDGEEVTVLGNTGSTPLTKKGASFAGWNTKPDGSGKLYKAGDAITISANTTLYAYWGPAVKAVIDKGGSASNFAVAKNTYNDTSASDMDNASNQNSDILKTNSKEYRRLKNHNTANKDINDDSWTLTYYYDNKDYSADNVIQYLDLPTTTATGPGDWPYISDFSCMNVTSVVIDKSMKEYTGFTTTAGMFGYLIDKSEEEIYAFINASSLSGCENLVVDNVIDMSNMFGFYGGMLEDDISVPNTGTWNTKNVKNMSSMFEGYGCCSETLDLVPDVSNWNTNNVEDMSSMFNGFASYSKTINVVPDTSKWITNNVKDMSNMFCQFANQSKTINVVPDTSKWNTNKVENISFMFYDYARGSETLNTVPDTSKWFDCNAQIKNMESTFECYGRHSEILSCVPNTKDWQTNNVVYMSSMFLDYAFNSKQLNNVPDTSGWTTNNVTTFSRMFSDYGYCTTALKYVPNVANWNTEKATNMDGLFKGYGHASHVLTDTPNVTNWSTKKVETMESMFEEYGHYNGSYNQYPFVFDLSSFDTKNVTNMKFMFSYTFFKTVYVSDSWDTQNVTESHNMFYCAETTDNKFQGGNGTTYSVGYSKDKIRAVADSHDNVGNLTYKPAASATTNDACIISYDLCGGTPGTIKPYNQQVKQGTKFTVQGSTADYDVKTGYPNQISDPVKGTDEFLGWSDMPNATTVKWNKEQGVVAQGTTMTLYAVWKSQETHLASADYGKEKSDNALENNSSLKTDSSATGYYDTNAMTDAGDQPASSDISDKDFELLDNDGASSSSLNSNEETMETSPDE